MVFVAAVVKGFVLMVSISAFCPPSGAAWHQSMVVSYLVSVSGLLQRIASVPHL